MKGFLVKAIPILLLCIFVIIMISDNYLKHPLGEDDNVPGFILLIIEDINNEKWEAADNNTELLSKAWRKVAKRIQFSAEKDEMNAFDVNIARLKGSIMVKEKAAAIMELNEALEHWENIGR